MRHEAVVLSYLEWVRLINKGEIRFDERRIFRWSTEKFSPLEIITSLMRIAPDLGYSANSYVLAMLKPEVLNRLYWNGIELGNSLSEEMVGSFHSFTKTACEIHAHDATAIGVDITLTELSSIWLLWVERMEAIERENNGKKLLRVLPPLEMPSREVIEWIKKEEEAIDYTKIMRTQDTMLYGWTCILNLLRHHHKVDFDLTDEIKKEYTTLKKCYKVDQPLFESAPSLYSFINNLSLENYAGKELSIFLALAAIKQHERYVIKREGRELDIDSFREDLLFLKKISTKAAAIFVYGLGERLPSDLVRAVSREISQKITLSIMNQDNIRSSSESTAINKEENITKIYNEKEMESSVKEETELNEKECLGKETDENLSSFEKGSREKMGYKKFKDKLLSYKNIHNITFTIEEIKNIIETDLPKTARDSQWWKKSSKRKELHKAWLEAGYHVEDVRFSRIWTEWKISFQRNSSSEDNQGKLNVD